MISPTHRPLSICTTQHSQETNIYAPGRIRTRNLRKRAALDCAATGTGDYTSQQDFGTRKVYCVSNVTFHAESKYAIKIFPSPTVFVQWPF